MRKRILGDAVRSFVEKGYAGTSTLQIATRAKVSKRDPLRQCRPMTTTEGYIRRNAGRKAKPAMREISDWSPSVPRK